MHSPHPSAKKTPACRPLALGAAVLGLTLSSSMAEAVSQQWATRLESPNSNDQHHALAVDAAGNVYSCGSYSNAGTLRDFHVTKYDAATGTVLWSYNRAGINGTSISPADAARSIAIAPDGSIYAAGQVNGVMSPDSFADAYLVKLNPGTGEVLWQAAWGSGDFATDSVTDMTVDSAGNVVMSCFLQTPPVSGTVLKVSSAGNLMWTSKIQNPVGVESSGTSNPQKVVVDAADNIFVVGSATFWGAGYELCLTKISGASGVRQWDWHGGYIGSSNSSGVGDLTLDPNGNAIVNGTYFGGYGHLGGPGNDSLTAKINGSTGAEMWRDYYDYGANGNELEGAVATDPNGDVYVAGSSSQSYSGGDFQIFTRKINGTTGEAMWTKRLANGFARDVAVTAQGDVLTLGYGGGAAILTKSEGADGSLIWSAPYSVGDTTVGSSFRTLAIRPDGSAVICTIAGGEWATAVLSVAADTDGDGTPDNTDSDDDNDGLPDSWELANGFNPLSAADASADSDGDRQSNSDEHTAGTNPRNGADVFKAIVSSSEVSPGSFSVSFQAVAGRTYTVQYRSELSSSGLWNTLQQFPSQTVSGPISVVDSPPAGSDRRFYQVVTPQVQ